MLSYFVNMLYKNQLRSSTRISSCTSDAQWRGFDVRCIKHNILLWKTDPFGLYVLEMIQKNDLICLQHDTQNGLQTCYKTLFVLKPIYGVDFVTLFSCLSVQVLYNLMLCLLFQIGCGRSISVSSYCELYLHVLFPLTHWAPGRLWCGINRNEWFTIYWECLQGELHECSLLNIIFYVACYWIGWIYFKGIIHKIQFCHC